jgi:hypothetical protein
MKTSEQAKEAEEIMTQAEKDANENYKGLLINFVNHVDETLKHSEFVALDRMEWDLVIRPLMIQEFEKILLK